MLQTTRKILWTDCETGGTEPKTDALLQLSGLIELDGEITDEIDLHIKPLKGKRITPDALKVTGIAPEDIQKFMEPSEAYEKFYKFLQVESKAKVNRFVVGGYNADFDLNFINKWFYDITLGPYAFWDYLQFAPIDILRMCRTLRYFGLIETENTKLETLCKYFGIKIKAHDSLSDIIATRELTYKIVNIYNEGLEQIKKESERTKRIAKALF